MMNLLKKYCLSKLLLSGQLPSEDGLPANHKFISEFKAHLMVWLSGENRIAGKEMVQAFLLFNQSTQSKKVSTVLGMLAKNFLAFCWKEQKNFASVILNPSSSAFGNPSVLCFSEPLQPHGGMGFSVFPSALRDFDNSPPWFLGVSFSRDGRVLIHPSVEKFAPYSGSISALRSAYQDIHALVDWRDAQPEDTFDAAVLLAWTVPSLDDMVDKRDVLAFSSLLNRIGNIIWHFDDIQAHQGPDEEFTPSEKFFRMQSKAIASKVREALLLEDMNIIRRAQGFMGGACTSPVSDHKGFLSPDKMATLHDPRYLGYATKV